MMDMAGNNGQMVVGANDSSQLSFQGSHGDGNLSELSENDYSPGHATQADWPAGCIVRGGNFTDDPKYGHTTCRTLVSCPSLGDGNAYKSGGRLVRTSEW